MPDDRLPAVPFRVCLIQCRALRDVTDILKSLVLHRQSSRVAKSRWFMMAEQKLDSDARNAIKTAPTPSRYIHLPSHKYRC